MISQLRFDSKEIPQPTDDDKMLILVERLQRIDIDIPARYKALWLTRAPDSNEDYIRSQKML